MLPDVAQAGGTQKGVAQGVQHNVAIGVSQDTVRMRHSNAAKHYKVAGPEGVNINS